MYVVAKLKEQQRKRSRLRHDLVDDAVARGPSGSTTQWGPSGWLIHAAPCSSGDDENRLARHTDWLGPAKLVGDGSSVQRLTEVFVSHELFDDQAFDADFNDQRETLLAELHDRVFANQSPGTKLDWRAPDTEKLRGWLSEGGFQPTVDDKGNLRLTLKARGCDGQVQVRRDDQCLRLTMRLGSWSSLDDVNEQAMLHLARQANDRGRLARIAWIVDENACRCEAQVDLTGLPTGGPAERIWPGMLCASMHGLALALRRLGMELEVLADPNHRNIAAQLIGSKPESVGVVPAADIQPQC